MKNITLKSSLLLALGTVAFGVSVSHGAGTKVDDLKFARACDAGQKITVAAVGDILLHSPLQEEGFREKAGFGALWSNVQPLLNHADVLYGNLEGPAAGNLNSSGQDCKDPGAKFDNVCYTGYPMFNYDGSILLPELQLARFSVVSTANNHAMDRGPRGQDRTIENIEATSIKYTGTRKEDDLVSPWYTVTQVQGKNIAWLACAWGTNGLKDPHHQVLLCYDDTAEILKTVSELAANPKIDAVIVTPHWGEEYVDKPDAKQVALGHQLLDAGATAVIGNHPHVIQPMEKYTTKDGREGFIIYSIGNFVSGQRELPKKTSAIIYLGLTFGSGSQKAWVNGVRYVPTVMEDGGDGLTLFEADKSGEHAPSWNRAIGQLPEQNAVTGHDILNDVNSQSFDCHN